MQKLVLTIALAILALQLFAQEYGTGERSPVLSVFAESKDQWTGIAISPNNRVFVNFPRWSEQTTISVAEIINGKSIPFPDTTWNNNLSKAVPHRRFICVQSIYVDDSNLLWVLDTGYELENDATKGAHLYGFSLADNSLQKEYVFPVEVITSKSYLNDFRIDNRRQVAFFTDSELGGIVILDMRTGHIRRVLAQHPSTLTEVDKITIEGYERKHPVHSDGIELDKNGRYLYYCALMGRSIYRVPTEALLDKNLTAAALEAQVEKFAATGANDGIIFDKKGTLYLSSLELNAISSVGANGKFEVVVSDARIKWPDSFSFDSNGNLYFTISQIHLPKDKRGSYKVFKLEL